MLKEYIQEQEIKRAEHIIKSWFILGGGIFGLLFVGFSFGWIVGALFF